MACSYLVNNFSFPYRRRDLPVPNKDKDEIMDNAGRIENAGAGYQDGNCEGRGYGFDYYGLK